MRVKVGEHWFSAEPGQPIAVELSEADRRNIANMSPQATRLGVFHGDEVDLLTSDQKREWLGRA